MPNLETSSSLRQPRIIEKVPKRKERFDRRPTDIPGVSVIHEPGVEVDIHRAIVAELYETTKGHVTRYYKIKGLEEPQKTSEKEIKASATANDGFRGIQSEVEEDNFILNVIPKDISIWDLSLLEGALGPDDYQSVVAEDVSITISVPIGGETKKGPVQEEEVMRVLGAALLKLGFPEADHAKRMKRQVDRTVDVETLDAIVEKSGVSLPEGTETIERGWTITVNPFDKSLIRKLAGIGDVAISSQNLLKPK